MLGTGEEVLKVDKVSFGELVIGTGIYGSLPVIDEVVKTAKELSVNLVVKKLKDAVLYLEEPDTNFVLHLTCRALI